MDGTLRLDRLQGNIVPVFRQAVRMGAKSADITRDQLGAKLIGRRKSGAKLGDQVERRDGPPGGRRRDAGVVSVPFQSYVSMTGGGYSFSPSIPALSHLVQPHGYVGRKESSNGLHSR
jgi:hypothetical protein